MKTLPRPSDQHVRLLSAGEIFETCVSMVRDAALRAQLTALRQNVENQSADYHTKGRNKTLYRMQPHTQVGGVAGSEFVKVYERMVRKNGAGRSTYDRILAAPPNGTCPMCGIGTVNTLDHYLPKKHFPVFSVTPSNLVPACKWCQDEKLEYFPETSAEQLLHPYYDDLGDVVWLRAEVVEGIPASFRYFADPPADWSRSMKDRVAAHLKELNLAELFSSNAGSRLAEIRYRLHQLSEKGGRGAVRDHLREDLASSEAVQKNSWISAMYRAAVASDWFCGGGYHST